MLVAVVAQVDDLVDYAGVSQDDGGGKVGNELDADLLSRLFADYGEVGRRRN